MRANSPFTIFSNSLKSAILRNYKAKLEPLNWNIVHKINIYEYIRNHTKILKGRNSNRAEKICQLSV